MDETKNRKLDRLMPYILLLLLVLSVFFITKTLTEFKNYRYAGSDIRPASTITVVGKGEIFAVPDTASFSVTVTHEAKTSAEAQAQVTEKMNSVIELLKQSGIEEKDIKTVGYDLYPRYEYNNNPRGEFYYPSGERALVGYEITHTISVKVRESEKAGEIVGKVGELNVSNISGISFISEDDEALISDARKLAIEDAKDKAKDLSKDLGVRLGRIVEFSDATNPYYPIMAREEAFGKGGDADVAMPAPDLPQGENKIVSQVYITYEIR